MAAILETATFERTFINDWRCPLFGSLGSKELVRGL